MQLTPSQKEVVQKLFNAFKEKDNYKFASFKAPTGSGKTFMASEFISRVFATEIASFKKTVFVVATISNAELPKQFARKLKDYKKYHSFNNYIVEYIESPSTRKTAKVESIPEFFLEDNKVFVFGTSSFGKNTLFYQNKTLDVFLQEASEQNYQIYFIRDEAHIGKKETISKDDLKTFDQKMKAHASFIIEMTATPKETRNLVEMQNEDVNSDNFYLLKTNQKKTELLNEVTNEEIIDDALKIFKESKKEYQKLKVLINPALLIQVMNDSDYKKDRIKHEQFNQGLELLEKKLQKAGLKYLKYLNNSPQVVGTKVPNTLAYASQIDSEIDAIIFKIGPATGWDIPRANMLLQIRNVSSTTLNLQTLGRIMRNPYPNLESNDITNKYYVWSNYQKPTRNEASYKLKSNFQNENFTSGFINKNSALIQKDDLLYKKSVIAFLYSKAFTDKVKDIDPLNDLVYEKISYGSAIVKNKILNHIYLKIDNYKKTREHANELKPLWFLKDFKNISKKLNVDIEIIQYVFFTFIDKLKQIKAKSTKWIKDEKPYELKKDAKTLSYYTLWKDNQNPKRIRTNDFVNYGYKQISDDEDIQYLDSTPELEFFQRFKSFISTSQRKQIHFFAKMPSLGSQVYYEYYSKKESRIAKSFMDFAIKYREKQIMVEVKSHDEDYDKAKTDDLLDAYKIYMKKFNNENLLLVLFMYNKKSDTPYLYGYINNKWEEEANFRDFFDQILD